MREDEFTVVVTSEPTEFNEPVHLKRAVEYFLHAHR